MKVNKNSPRRPLRPLSAIIDFPTPAGRRWGKHFRDGKKSSECWEREQPKKVVCVCVCLERCHRYVGNGSAATSVGWWWRRAPSSAIPVGWRKLTQGETYINTVGFDSHVAWSVMSNGGGGKFQYRPTRETASRNRHGVLTVPSTCRVVYYWHDDRGTWARVGKQSKRIAMATP